MEAVVILALIVVGYLVAQASQKSNELPAASGDWNARWGEAANDLELSHRSSNNATMRGEIDGHRVRVSSYRGRNVEIEVRYNSGVRKLEIEPRRKRSSTDREEFLEDPDFEARFLVRLGFDDDDRARGERWLTPERREIITILDDALEIDEIEENEIEVKLRRDDWLASELAQAVRLCVLAAQTLDESFKATPQDSIRPAPQDDVRDGPQDAVRRTSDERES